MKPSIQILQIKELTRGDFLQCKKLTLHDGQMQEKLMQCKREEKGIVILIKENEEVLSWCLLSENSFNSRWRAYFYTKKKYRGQGYGKMLAEKVNQLEKAGIEVEVCPWNKKSDSFFQKFAFNLADGYFYA